MIDIKAVRDDPDRVRASQQARGEDPSLVDALLAADERRRAAVLRFDTVRAEQKSLGKQVAARWQGSCGRTAGVAGARADLAAEVKEAEAELAVADEALRSRRWRCRTSSRPACPRAARTTSS